MRRFSNLLAAVLCCGMLLIGPQNSRADSPEPLGIAVAANFRSTAVALAKEFEQRTLIPVRISSASTGVLSTQIRNGAPFDLLLAADAARPAGLRDDGYTRGEPRCYALGSLVLLGAPQLNAALADPRLSVAIANPRSAPYGAAALAVLTRPGFAGPEERRVVLGSNVQQAAQFFHSGATDIALLATAVAGERGLAIPRDWHPAIEQHAVVLEGHTDKEGRTGKEAAQDFLDFLGSDAARQVIISRGYEPCS